MIETHPAYPLVFRFPKAMDSKPNPGFCIDLWNTLPEKQRKKIDEAEFGRVSKILMKTSLEFYFTYFQFRYLRHNIPRSVYRGYFYVETEPKKSLTEVLDLIKKAKENKMESWAKGTLLSLKKLNIDPNMILLKGAKVCYVTAFKEIKNVFDNVLYKSETLEVKVRIIGEPVPVLFYLQTEEKPATVLQPLLTRFDEFDYMSIGNGKYFVLVLFRSNQRPQPFCNSKTSLCYLTCPLTDKRPSEIMSYVKIAPKQKAEAKTPAKKVVPKAPNVPKGPAASIIPKGPAASIIPKGPKGLDLSNVPKGPKGAMKEPQKEVKPASEKSKAQSSTGSVPSQDSAPAANAPAPISPPVMPPPVMPDTLYSLTQHENPEIIVKAKGGHLRGVAKRL